MTETLLQTRIQLLPYDILHFYIIPYTYSPQSSTLLSDIRNFIETREKISDIYHYRNRELLLYERNADKEWLVSDILLFTKRNNNDLYRLLKYMHNDFIFTKKNIYSQFNIFWSFLSPTERNYFIQIRKIK
jgi:hypothetical protein